MAVLQQFTCFENLPGELRLKIWEFALPSPWLLKSRKINAKYKYFVSPVVLVNIPAQFDVNHESRAEALKSYKKLLSKECLDECLLFFCDTPGINGFWINSERNDVHFFQYLADSNIDEISPEVEEWELDRLESSTVVKMPRKKAELRIFNVIRRYRRFSKHQAPTKTFDFTDGLLTFDPKV